MEVGGGGGWPRASLWSGVGRSQRGAEGGSEEDNPQAAMKAAAVGVRAWHCRGFLLLCCGYQQKSASPESWVKRGADGLVPFLWSVSQGMFGDIQLKVEEPGGVQSPGQSLVRRGVGL